MGQTSNTNSNSSQKQLDSKNKELNQKVGNFEQILVNKFNTMDLGETKHSTNIKSSGKQ